MPTLCSAMIHITYKQLNTETVNISLIEKGETCLLIVYSTHFHISGNHRPFIMNLIIMCSFPDN